MFANTFGGTPLTCQTHYSLLTRGQEQSPVIFGRYLSKSKFYFICPGSYFLPVEADWKLAVGAIVLAIVFRGVLAYTVGIHLAGALLPFGCSRLARLGSPTCLFQPR